MDRSSAIERFANLIEQEPLSYGVKVYDKFPINRICGIHVMINYEIEVNREYNFCFSKLTIVTSSIFDDNQDAWLLYRQDLQRIEQKTEFTHENYVKDVKKILTIIPLLHISKQEGMFIIGKERIDEELVELFKFDNTITLYEKCCICYELCGSKIQACNHILCITCFLSMPKKVHECDGGECDDCGKKTCPLCRNEFEFLKRLELEEY